MPEAEEMVDLRTTIPKELHMRFVRVCPPYGATAWFVRTAMEAFVAEMEAHPEIHGAVHDAVRKMMAESYANR